MKISWKSTNYGQTGFHVDKLGEYDATPPVDALLLDRAPRTLNPERQAIAAYLAFSPWISGELHLPQRLGPNTAAAIERDLAHVQVRPAPVEYYPKPLEVGLREVSVVLDELGHSGNGAFINVVRASEWAGSLRGLQSIVVSSNAFALDSAASTETPSIRARLAVAVLFAGEISADILVLPQGLALSDAELDSLRSLLLAARLGLEVA
ncbi:hypothetical protein ACT3TE_09605 [Brachybacterium sp. AOP42-B2-9]|uniref:hypothetical protein n=1 Tax=Brachybacterium sp. AOP42-B2-9 TaxID=3457672 RepID=UPI004034C1E0